MVQLTFAMPLFALQVLSALAMDCSGTQTAMDAVQGKSLGGQTYVITGGDTGMGYETALALASTNASIIMACRSQTRCPAAAANITQATGNTHVSVIRLDLSNFSSVRECAAVIRKRVSRIDVLIADAGIMTNPSGLPAKTDDGFDRIYQVSSLSNHLLVQELLPLLRASNARVVNVASIAAEDACMWGNYLPFCTTVDKLAKFAKISPRGVNVAAIQASNYAVAKYVDVFLTAELARREPNITAVSLHPGMVLTGMSRHITPWTTMELCCAMDGQSPCPRTPQEGATTQTYLAVAPKQELVNGRYYDSCKLYESVRDRYAKKQGEPQALVYQSSIYDMVSELVGLTEFVIAMADTHEDITVIDLCNLELMGTCAARNRMLNFPHRSLTPTYSWNVTATLSGSVTAPTYDVVVAFQENLPPPFNYQIPLGRDSGAACGTVNIPFGVGSKGDRSPLPCLGCHVALTFPPCSSGWQGGDALLIDGVFNMGFFLIPGYEPTPNITVNITLRGNEGRVIDLTSHQRPTRALAGVIV